MYQVFDNFMIRDFGEEDAPSIAKYANNRKIWQYLRDAFPYPYYLKDAKEFLARVFKADTGTVFAIATKKEAIGSIGLMIGQDVHRYTAELGYWLAEPFWGKGIMTSAVKFMTLYAMNELKLYRIYAEPFITNPASARVLEKAGFIQEGILYSNAFKDGKVLDQYLYSYIGIKSK